MKRIFGRIYSGKLSVFAVLSAFAALQACSPVPRHNLTTEEKAADLYWLYSQFGENYAPLEYKQTKHSFSYDELKSHTLELAKATQNNEDFYRVMYGFVAQFKDAHSGSYVTNSSLPGRAQVAYLGFTGIRSGEHFVVRELLATIKQDESHFPIEKGDVITKLDGVPLVDLIKTELVKLRDLGSDEANLTFHMNRAFNRLSTETVFPSADNAVLSVLRDDKEVQITLPWVKKDLSVFQMEQDQAKKDKKEKDSSPSDSADVFVALSDQGAPLFHLGFVGFDGRLASPFSEALRIRRENKAEFNYLKTFRFVDGLSGWTTIPAEPSAVKEKSSGNPVQDRLAKLRPVPENAIFLTSAKSYPTYVSRVKILDREGKETPRSKLVATMYLDTFSPTAGDKDVLKEIHDTLAQLQELGVDSLMIDMINNGGGSLELGLQMAQLFSNQKITLPEIQFVTSETWMDQFEGDSLSGPSDAERELSRRLFNALRDDRAAGHRLSRRFSTESLMPFVAQPNTDLDGKLKIVLMVNEMCASMCDIFTATLKDNGLATVVGTRTMGAGGNVVEHPAAPNSHLVVRQTESLILRKDGSYIENNGVEPDLAVKVNESATKKYAPVYEESRKLLAKE